MRVLGYRPGPHPVRVGRGRRARPGARPTAIGVGVIRTLAELDLELRLLELHTADRPACCGEHRPDVVAIERVFTQNNEGTAMGTAQAAGVATLARRPGRPAGRLAHPQRGQGRRSPATAARTRSR